MNSRAAWGIAQRNNILTFVRENGETTTKELREKFGDTHQLKVLVDRGQLVRIGRGRYEFREVSASVK